MINPMIQNTGQYDILIVDDTRENRELLSRLLKERGYRVRPATNGRHALRSVAAKLPDLILLDVKMPEMDGYEVCRRLKSDKHSRNVPVIFISAYGETAKKVEGFKAGGVDYIAKPFESEEVIARVETQLCLHELAEHLERQVDHRTQQLQQEILERKQAQEQLKESEKRYSEIVEGTDNLITEVDAEGRFIFVNETARKVFGMHPNECIGRMAFDFIHPDDREITRNSFLQWVKDKKPSVTFENRQMSRSGKVTDMHWTINLNFDDKGDIASIKSIARDVTEQKKAQAALSREAEINLAAAELSRNLLSPASIDDISFLVLEQAKRLTRSAFGFVGHFDPETGYLVCPTLTRDIWDTCQVAVADKNIVFKKFTGLWGWVLENRKSLLTNAAVDDPRSAGTPPGHIPIHRFLSAPALIGETLVGQVAVANSDKDYTEYDLQVIERLANLYAIAIQRQRAEQELERHRDRLEEMVKERTVEIDVAKKQAESARISAEKANAAKSDFLACMSHDIRTPLNAIIGLTNMVLKSELTPEQRDYLNKVQMASDNLLAVINDILDFSKVEAGRLMLERHPFDLDMVMEQLADLFSEQIAEKDLELIYAVNPNVPRQLTGDGARLAQVLINLIQNAIKFTESGEIVVGVEQEAQPPRDQAQAAIKFWVRDTGTGIAAEVLPTLFEPFTQAEGYLTRKHEGTGLGLAICRRIVGLMGGRIWAESTPGRGSTFSFTVLLETRKEEKPRLSLPADLHGLKALVVDDNATVRQELCDLLESFHFNVSAVESGEKAIESFRRAAASEPYQLVLMDWKMPGLDGIETAEAIHNNSDLHRPPIILVTAYERELLQKRVGTASVDSLLLKPVKPSQIFNAITELFGRAEAMVPPCEQKLAARPIHRLAGLRVLVVEDIELNRVVAVALLEQAGLNVETAEDGRIAVDMVKESPRGHYNAVLMDIQMPVMDGFEATRHIREWEAASQVFGHRIPIIALTAHALTGEKEKCFAAGMDDYVVKPIDEKQLERVLLKRIASKQGEADTSNRLQAGGTSDEQTALDVQGALKRIGGRSQIYVQALKKFAPDCGKAHEIIRRYLAAHDKEAASRMAHSVKGAAAAIGAVRLSPVAAKLETAIKNEGPDINVLLSGFNSELEQALKAVDRFLKTESEG